MSPSRQKLANNVARARRLVHRREGINSSIDGRSISLVLRWRSDPGEKYGILATTRRFSRKKERNPRGEWETGETRTASRTDAFTRGRSKLYDETKSMFGPQEPTEYLSISVARETDSLLKGPTRIGRVPTISRHDSYGDSPTVIHRMLLIRVSANVSITWNTRIVKITGHNTPIRLHADECHMARDPEDSLEMSYSNFIRTIRNKWAR